MDFGVGYFPTHDGIGPGPLARMLEERGQESLFFAEHTHIPASRESPYPAGGELPQKYWHCYDLFVALTAAAAATSRLRVGSGICLIIERDPIVTAKEVASVDHLSGGRMEFGVGAGWNREEMQNHGTDPRTRMALMRERVEAMKAIWTQEEASYAGEYVTFDRIWSEPKPAQRPHPPVLVGCPTMWPTIDSSNAWRSCAPARSARSRFTSSACRRIPTRWNACATRALGARCSGCRPEAAARSRRRSSAGRPRSPSSTASDGGTGAPALRGRHVRAPGER